VGRRAGRMGTKTDRVAAAGVDEFVQVAVSVNADRARQEGPARRAARRDCPLGQFTGDHGEHGAPGASALRHAAMAGRRGSEPQLTPRWPIEAQVNRPPRVEPDQVPPSRRVAYGRPEHARQATWRHPAGSTAHSPERRCGCGHAGKLSELGGSRNVQVHCRSFDGAGACVATGRSSEKGRAVRRNTKDRGGAQLLRRLWPRGRAR
jgi:hypothetical protein